MTSTQDIYWLAGILEGEGSFSCSSKCAGGVYPHIQINMRDQDVVERVRVLLGAKKLRSYLDKRPNRKPQWFEVRLTGRRAVGWMMTLYPLMGIRRRIRIRELIAKWQRRGVNKSRCRATLTHV